MTPLLAVDGLIKHFPLRGGLLNRIQAVVRAVDDVSFSVAAGETLGIVGESGCGKSTTARLLMHLVAADRGTIAFEGKAVGVGEDLSRRDLHRQMQMVFQDSYASLNPRLPVSVSIAFGPLVHGLAKSAALSRAMDLLEAVGLDPLLFANRYPHELSGGQRQRINVARALALEPRLVILDEAVSALDKSIEAQVLNLLIDLKERFDLTYIFISHDLNVVRFISDRVMVMYLGKIVELGPVGRDLSRAEASLYKSAALGDAVDGPASPNERGAAQRRPSQPDQSAFRLPLPYPLSLCRAAVRRRATGARDGLTDDPSLATCWCPARGTVARERHGPSRLGRGSAGPIHNPGRGRQRGQRGQF